MIRSDSGTEIEAASMSLQASVVSPGSVFAVASFLFRVAEEVIPSCEFVLPMFGLRSFRIVSLRIKGLEEALPFNVEKVDPETDKSDVVRCSFGTLVPHAGKVAIEIRFFTALLMLKGEEKHALKFALPPRISAVACLDVSVAPRSFRPDLSPVCFVGPRTRKMELGTDGLWSLRWEKIPVSGTPESKVILVSLQGAALTKGKVNGFPWWGRIPIILVALAWITYFIFSNFLR